MASTFGASSSLPPLQTDHRKLLNPDNPDDSPVTDQEDALDRSIRSPDDASAIGISISQVQTYMKSPQTPAIEKQRALDRSLGYFDAGFAASAIPEHGDGTDSTKQPAESGPTERMPPVPTPWKVHPPAPTHRSSIADALNEAKNVTKRRSLSGSNMFESLKKMLPDLPSLPTLKSQPFYSSFSNEPAQKSGHSASDAAPGDRSGRSEPSQRSELRSRPLFSQIGGLDGTENQTNTSSDAKFEGGIQSHDHQSLRRSDTAGSSKSKRHSDPPAPPSTIQKQTSGLDGSVESLLSPTSPGRRNSEGSIYLSRRVSGMSNFDDTDAWAHVTEMANSRFKAITDSFQSSTLRFPRLPNVKTNFGKTSPSSDDEETARNTQLNSQTSSKPRSSTKDREKFYTNMHNIRKSKKLIEIETSQNRAHPILSSAFDELEGDLVIMGGYRGSILREAKPPNRQLWAPVKVGLNLRKADLEVGLTREDEERASETIVPSGVLSHIGPIDICRRLLKHARKCPGVKDGNLRVHDWGYDWRLSPHLLAGRLIKYLESLQCNQPSTPKDRKGVWMIAHSLGGLITRYVVNLRPELFAGVLYAGTPMNCVNILGPLRNGDDVLLSSKVLTAQVNFTIRTSFALLPEDGRCFINKETNERYDLDFFDPQTWEDWHLSPCIRAAIDPTAVAKQRDRSKSLVGMMAQSVTNLPRPSFLSTGSESSRSNTLTSKPSHSLSQASAGTAESNTELAKKQSSGPEVVQGVDATDTTRAAETSVRATASAYADHLVSEPVGEAAVEPVMSKGQSSRPAVATACTLDPTAAREYLARTLAEVLAFKRALQHKPEFQQANRYPPHALIFGKTVPTVYGAKVVSKEAIKYTDCFEDLAFAAGDGVVLASAAQLPEGYRVVKGGRIESDRGHVGLLGDLEGVGAALKALMEGRRKGVGMGCFDEQ
jgi:pimeloyl-ACP methyl ester carboxylesterase